MATTSVTMGRKVSEFIQTFLTLNGSFAGEPFMPLEWMETLLDMLFETNISTERRRYRTFLLSIARKNAKSTFGAAIALYMLVADRSDNEPLIISAAGDRPQAKLVFKMAKGMVEASPELSAVCEVFSNEIRCTLNGGVYQVISADAARAHGLNPSCIIADELHVWPNDELYVALNTGSAARREPLTIVLSTPGYDIDTTFGRLVQYGRRAESGEIDDRAFGLLEFGPGEEGSYDPMDEAVWEACNPSWDFMNLEEFRTNAKQMPLNDFIRYRLGGWVSAKSAWLPTGAWADCESKEKTLERGDLIVLGLDGSWKGDSTALVACRLSDLHMEVIGHWEQDLDDPQWRVPLNEVEDTCREALEYFSVREFVADPYRVEKLLQDLAADGYPVVDFPSNSIARMGPATESFYVGVINQTLSHDGDLALARHMSNAILKTDARGARVTKDHKSSSKKIDLVIAAVIAHHRALMHVEDEAPPEAQLLVM